MNEETLLLIRIKIIEIQLKKSPNLSYSEVQDNMANLKQLVNRLTKLRSGCASPAVLTMSNLRCKMPELEKKNAENNK